MNERIFLKSSGTKRSYTVLSLSNVVAREGDAKSSA